MKAGVIGGVGVFQCPSLGEGNENAMCACLNRGDDVGLHRVASHCGAACTTFVLCKNMGVSCRDFGGNYFDLIEQVINAGRSIFRS